MVTEYFITSCLLSWVAFKSLATTLWLGSGFPWAPQAKLRPHPSDLWSEKTQVPVRPLGGAAAPRSEAFPVVVQCSWDFLAGLVPVPEEKAT